MGIQDDRLLYKHEHTVMQGRNVYRNELAYYW